MYRMSIKQTRMVQMVYPDQSEILAQPEYGTVYQHQGMLLQNLNRHYLYIVIRLPKLKNLEQKITTFLNCDNYGIHRS